MEHYVNLPLTEETAKMLRAGDTVYLTGEVYTSRDAGHKRMVEAMSRGEALPFDPMNATIYYVGPSPARPGQVIGSAGPTTSGRMDAYAPRLLDLGARGMIGKGARSPEVIAAMMSTVEFTSEPSAARGRFSPNASKRASSSLGRISNPKP